METFVLLLRGINVGGTGKLPMADLRTLLIELGARDVATYIQSGNAVFRSEFDARDLAQRLEDQIETRFGFRPDALIMSGAELTAILNRFPFPAAFDAPKTGHILFLTGPPQPDLDKMQEIGAPDEAYALDDTCFYLHAPSGIGRSKLAAKIEKLLGVSATARNLNTVSKLAEMVAALP